MWAGERIHYDASETKIMLGDVDEDKEDEEQSGHHGNRFRSHFTLPESEKLHAGFHGYLLRVVPIYGKIYVGDTMLCFRALLPGVKTKVCEVLSFLCFTAMLTHGRWSYL